MKELTKLNKITKFFKDNDDTVQEMPVEVLDELFPHLKGTEEAVQKNSNQWRVLNSGANIQGVNWQVVVQNIISVENLFYHVFIFNPDNEFLAHLYVQAVQSVPPVSEKINGPDYFDWLEIQGAIFKWLADNKYKVFRINLKPEGKMVYLTKESPEEVAQSIKENRQYSILAVKADKFLEKLEEKKKNAAVSQDII